MAVLIIGVLLIIGAYAIQTSASTPTLLILKATIATIPAAPGTVSIPAATTPTPGTVPMPTPTTPTIPTPAYDEVWIWGGDYRPGTITVPVGTRVTWTNKDYDAHDIDSDTGLFFCSLALGVSFSYTFDTRGTFNYHCGCAPGMVGKIIVE
mgnify:CR=1 FL=1